MALFCLVHGSTQSPAGWDRLVPELHRRGHQTVSPELPADQPQASATHYAEVIAQAIPAEREDVIVVAHSASGLFLPLVPQFRPVRRLVFLAAILPKIGVSLVEQFKAEPQMLRPDWLGKDPTRDDQVALRFLFHDCPPELLDWALSTRRLLHAQHALTEICPLKAWPAVPSSYILPTEDRTIDPFWFRRAVPERLGVKPIELPGGHCPHVSRPIHLAKILATFTA